MSAFKDYLIGEVVSLHISLNYKPKYENNETGTYERLKDIIKYEQLLEIMRNNPEWDSEELGREVSGLIRKKTSLN